ncbi:efflux RND transporter periplasmic adaptor subunit [Plantactinospora sp. KBS50]|uniref:efflux RND transporter periplasmic adaptor subunit n=1 Tax=Plantactinospora sp. KBS50 TaxID=2024580 RepID=UPI000BAABB57|nr:efflux RND transporter periplasmic adaptor subunit [Plantactinospora sp. KBS50]ASW53158.1 hypothetical protein CIK06_01625 [Plantactinospora sp. KBS50]
MGFGLDLVRRWRGARRGRWVVAGGVVAIGLLGTASAYALTTPEAAPAPAPTTAVDRGDVTVAVATVGTLQPGQQRQLSFATAGTVTEVGVRPGDTVPAGRILAAIDDGPAQEAVSAAQDALTQAEEALTAARQAPTAASCTDAAAAAGTRVAARTVSIGWQTTGSPAATGTPSPSPSATTTPTPSATATASASPDRATASPSAGASRSPGGGGDRPAGGCADSGSRSGGGAADTGSGDSVLRAQQQVTSAELRLAQARDAYAGTTITAPVAGKVLSVAGPVGGQVTAGSAFIQLGVVDDMQVAASFPEADAGRLRTGLTATVALADRPGEEFPARVTQVDPVGVNDSGLVRYGTLIAFDQVPADLLVGQSAQVRVTVVTVSDVLRVPSTAVHVGADGTGSVRLDGAAEPREVVVGVRGDQYTEIRSGLTGSERVWTSW